MKVIRIGVQRVVAFDSRGMPLKVPLSKWKVDFNETSESIDLRYKSTRLRYRLRGDLEAVTKAGESSELALGKTLGRLALTGLAGSLLSQGKGMGAALMDLSVRGAERRKLAELLLVFADTTTVSVVVSGEDLDQLRSMLPGWFFSEKAWARMEKFARLVERMALDGERVLTELQGRVSELKDEIEKCKKAVDQGETFAVRDAAREKVSDLASEIAYTESLARVVRWELNQADHSIRDEQIHDQGLIRRAGGFLFFLICVGSFFVVGFIGAFFAAMLAAMVGLESTQSGFWIMFGWLGAFGAWLFWALRKRRRSVSAQT